MVLFEDLFAHMCLTVEAGLLEYINFNLKKHLERPYHIGQIEIMDHSDQTNHYDEYYKFNHTELWDLQNSPTIPSIQTLSTISKKLIISNHSEYCEYTVQIETNRS